MKYFGLSIILALLSCFTLFSSEVSDTLEVEQSREYLSYEDAAFIFSNFDGLSAADVISKSEILVSTARDDKERALLAWYAYKFYRTSDIMGYEEAAIYYAQNYFLNGRCSLPEGADRLEMNLFVQLNSSSLIGMKAPELTLKDAHGESVCVDFSGDDFSVLYFFDDECMQCRRTTPALVRYVASLKNIRLTLYMVYTQDRLENWMDYLKKLVNPIELPANVRVVHLWDPQMESDFAMKYGVISTPSIFLFDTEGIIIGRRLTPNALKQVIDNEMGRMSQTEQILDRIFTPYAMESDTLSIYREIDSLFEESKSNPDFFHELFFAMYQFFKSNVYYSLQQGAAYLATNYIVSRPELWEGVTFTDRGKSAGSVIRADFESVKDFIGQTALAVEMFKRNPLGQECSDLLLRTPDNKKFLLSSMGGTYKVLYFYNTDCELCEAVTPAMKQIFDKYSAYDVEFAAIYIGRNKKWRKDISLKSYGWHDLWDSKRASGMFEKYDLMDVPAIYLLDGDNVTLAKDINPDVLSLLLDYYLGLDKDRN